MAFWSYIGGPPDEPENPADIGDQVLEEVRRQHRLSLKSGRPVTHVRVSYELCDALKTALSLKDTALLGAKEFRVNGLIIEAVPEDGVVEVGWYGSPRKMPGYPFGAFGGY